MKISKQDLLSALEKVKPGLANKEIIEQSSSFAFIGDRVVTYNDEISISHPVADLDLTGAIKAESLYSFLGKIKSDDITAELEENQVVIKAGRAKAGLLLEQEVKLPVEEVGEIGNWYDIPENLIDAMQFCQPCCSRDMARPVLTCLNIETNNVQASDSFQIIKYALSSNLPVGSFLLPASSAVILARYPVKQVAKGDSWVHFRTDDGTVFSSRILADQFPDIAQFLSFSGDEVHFPANISQALERAKVFSKGDINKIKIVTVEITKGKIVLSAQDEGGWFNETARTKYEGKNIKFMVGVDFLIAIMSHTPVCEYGANKIKFTGENWEHVIAVNVL